jgi:serine/threonine protein kinase
MPLTAGTRFGQYEILGPLGAGGMGEVYRALDTKLQREVAIKVLPEALADDRGRLVRFAREAQALAALNHPNIATIYGVEDGATRGIVMELVGGVTLAELLSGAPDPATRSRSSPGQATLRGRAARAAGAPLTAARGWIAIRKGMAGGWRAYFL